MQLNFRIRPNKKNMCGSGYPTYPKNFTPYPKLFSSKFLSLKKMLSEKYNQTVHLKKKTKGFCILKDFFLLILEEKELFVCVEA